MNVLGRLALLFVIVPIIELVLLIQLGQVVGLLPTLALVVFTGLTGAWLARAEGVRVLFQFQKEMATGKLPGQALLADAVEAPAVEAGLAAAADLRIGAIDRLNRADGE